MVTAVIIALPQLMLAAVIFMLFRQRAKDQEILRETIAKAFLLEATRKVQAVPQPVIPADPAASENEEYEDYMRELKQEAEEFERHQEEAIQARRDELKKRLESRQRSAMSDEAVMQDDVG